MGVALGEGQQPLVDALSLGGGLGRGRKESRGFGLDPGQPGLVPLDQFIVGPGGSVRPSPNQSLQGKGPGSDPNHDPQGTGQVNQMLRRTPFAFQWRRGVGVVIQCGRKIQSLPVGLN